jgi:hypothetical protein
MKCSSCGRELEERKYGVTWRACFSCKSPLCFECIHYVAVRKKGLYKEYIETIPVCKNCTPKKKIAEKLAKIVDEVLR